MADQMQVQAYVQAAGAKVRRDLTTVEAEAAIVWATQASNAVVMDRVSVLWMESDAYWDLQVQQSERDEDCRAYAAKADRNRLVAA